MRGIYMNDFYMCININQDGILYVFEIQVSEKDEPQSQLTHTNNLFCFHLIFMQTYVNIFQIKLLYIFLYLVNATIRILNKCFL